MARRVVWAADARRDLRDMFIFISERNPLAADRLEQLIVEGAERAAALPFAYRKGRVLHARQLYP